MNKQQIKAELRRSACEDKSPWHGVDEEGAFEAALSFVDPGNMMIGLEPEELRTFFLLVAEAL
jgi:hypothetical protein